MKEVSMDIDWRTVQLFIGEDGVSEVSIDADNHRKVRCNCKAFNTSARCKHTKFVRASMEDTNGHYSIHIPVDISDEEAIEAMSDADSFRDFIIKYGKVEVL